MKRKNYIKNFQVTEAMLQQLITMGKKEGVKYDAAGYKRSKKTFKNLIKALIARRVWQEKGFYPVWNNGDRTFNKALELFNKAADLQN